MMRILPLAAFLAICLFLGYGLLFKSGTELPVAYDENGPPLPDFSLPTLDGNAQFSPHDWPRTPFILNVFASWCLPCKAEHPLLMELGKKHNIPLYGIGWHDKAANISGMLQQMGNPFVATGIDTQGDSTVLLGLTGVPETLIVDAQRRVVLRLKTPLTPETVAQQILPVLERLRHGR